MDLPDVPEAAPRIILDTSRAIAMGNPAVARLKIGLYRLYAVEKYPMPTGVIIKFRGI